MPQKEKRDISDEIIAAMDKMTKGSASKEPKDAKPEHEENKDPKDVLIAELQGKVAELTDLLKRNQAEFLNYKNRTDKENKVIVEYANSDIVKKLLPVVDSFEMALKNTDDPESFKKGMEMIHSQLMNILKQEGLSPIDVDGKKFDPYLHEVLMKEKSDKEEDTVIDEFQRGYKFKDRVIRHSKVKLSGK
jgi:molecular chaperone GrpE